ncbi:hypothetical protein ESA94_10955 [Lacibacter luteus]|uniref:Uncharacterized protein n=1 Tax=Lacibacter luteus TaxID=2508719 RepID=A0A4V1M7R2_9BACT|nr:hypothetical protein [Lacibacter luteus]RXK60965.1 hypothetical protein ESA94_10955 [Lacibacter luteus]
MKTQIYLKPVIGHVAASLLPVAVLRHSFFINDVSPDLQLLTDEKKVAAAVKKLLLEELLQTDYACIRISALLEKDLLQLTVHKKGPFALSLS